MNIKLFISGIFAGFLGAFSCLWLFAPLTLNYAAKNAKICNRSSVCLSSTVGIFN